MDITSIKAQERLQIARQNFEEGGVFTLPNFITLEALKEIQNETIPKADFAFECNSNHNIYLLPTVDKEYPTTHVRNRQYPTRVASIAFDELDREQVLVKLYESDLLTSLIAQVTGQKKCYHSADILGRCSVNVFKNGWKHAWHFDESEYSTTLMIQKPEHGGIFQYTAPLRNNSNDLVEDLVESAMDDDNQAQENEEQEQEQGEATKITKLESSLTKKNIQKKPLVRRKNLTFEEGTLSIFSGRKSLHRVTECSGNLDRLVAVFTFASEEAYKNSPEVRKLFWGRTGEEEENQPVDSRKH